MKPIIFLLLASTLLPLTSRASADICPTAADRPCVALVLGGGGARGGAHIGVIRALEEQRIPVDLVVGTSIGSFVGALYASGKTADDIEALFAGADWNIGYRDKLPRSDMPNRRKRQRDAYPIHLDLGVGAEGLKLPQGLLQGQGMKNLIDRLLGTHVVFQSFDDLPIAYRAVAADIENGETVILASGDLSTAMQISMSLPGIVRPIEHEGRLLVDGGIADNLPIGIAQQLGADVVIAVDIGTPAQSREELTSSLSILRQLTNFLSQKNEVENLALLRSSDIHIKPKLDDVGLLSFDKALSAADSGYRAAIESLSNHSGIAKLKGKAIAHPTETFLAGDSEIQLDKVRLVNHSRLSDEYILKRMDLSENRSYTPSDIHHGMQRLYGQGTIARVRTSLHRDNGEITLNTLVDEKEWGPGYLDFKLSFEDTFKTQSQYQLGAAYRRTNLSPYGAEWYTTFEFGTDKRLGTELYWPIKTTGFFWETGIGYHRDVYAYTVDQQSLGEVTEDGFDAQGGIGWDGLDKFDIFSGLYYSNSDISVPLILTEVIGQRNLDVRQQGALVRLSYDSLDDVSFPRRGWQMNATVKRATMELLDIHDNSTQVEISLVGAKSLGRHALRARLDYRSTFNDDPLSVIDTYELGGFLYLSGNASGFISGKHTRFMSLVYTFELAENNFHVLNLPLYLGASVEAGNAWNARDHIDYDALIQSASLFLGWDSPVGPAYLAWGQSDTGNESVYIFMGVDF